NQQRQRECDDTPLSFHDSSSVFSSKNLQRKCLNASAAAHGAETISQQMQERAKIVFSDETVAVDVASPRAAVRAILREMSVVRHSVGELELERRDVGSVDEAIAVAVAALRLNQSIDRRSRREDDLAIRSLRDVDERRSFSSDDGNRIRRVEIVEVEERARDV